MGKRFYGASTENVGESLLIFQRNGSIYTHTHTHERVSALALPLRVSSRSCALLHVGCVSKNGRSKFSCTIFIFILFKGLQRWMTLIIKEKRYLGRNKKQEKHSLRKILNCSAQNTIHKKWQLWLLHYTKYSDYVASIMGWNFGTVLFCNRPIKIYCNTH